MKAIAMNRVFIMVATAVAANGGLWLASAYPAVHVALCTGG